MLAAAVVLAALALAGLVTPLVLLGLSFAVGAGQTLSSATWQTLQPEQMIDSKFPPPGGDASECAQGTSFSYGP